MTQYIYIGIIAWLYGLGTMLIGIMSHDLRRKRFDWTLFLWPLTPFSAILRLLFLNQEDWR